MRLTRSLRSLITMAAAVDSLPARSTAPPFRAAESQAIQQAIKPGGREPATTTGQNALPAAVPSDPVEAAKRLAAYAAVDRCARLYAPLARLG
jgi:hypothetical protein